MTEVLLTAPEGETIPVACVAEGALEALSAFEQGLAGTAEFKGKTGQLLAVPGADGRTARVLFGIGDAARVEAMAFRALPTRLPAGDYRIEGAPDRLDGGQIALAFALGSYGFDRYRKKRDKHARLVVAGGVDVAEIREITHACALAKDMVNTPANDMGPLQIETIAREIAEQHGASFSVITGDALLAEGYPSVHAVGRAADPARSPRMIEMQWGEAGKPLVAIVGKGVVFDTGGLDIKPSAGMRNMKKDMGGAAHALALGRMLMAAKLPIRVAVLIPAVENAISGDAMRPGDVLDTRKGLTVEVGNTDAEGRLILCDALHYARRYEPESIIDVATLTGACVIALGAHHSGVMSNDDGLAEELVDCGLRADDRAWQLPLTEEYGEQLKSNFADLANVAGRDGGAITAAAFLGRFTRGLKWAHLDIAGTAYLGGANKGSTGRPVGLLADFLIRRAGR